jgi:hypothetical protein
MREAWFSELGFPLSRRRWHLGRRELVLLMPLNGCKLGSCVRLSRSPKSYRSQSMFFDLRRDMPLPLAKDDVNLFFGDDLRQPLISGVIESPIWTLNN